MSESNKETNQDLDKNIRRGDFAKKRGDIVLREHVFDGIEEYDQQLPRWWLVTLWGAIIFFFIYYISYYTLGWLPVSMEQMNAREKEIEQQRIAAVERVVSGLNNDALVNKFASDPDVLKKGKAIYKQHCVACHAADMQSNGGATARSLVDGVWHYGSEPMDVLNLILNGTPKESEGYKMMRMEVWKDKIGAEKCAQVTAFIINANPKDFEQYKK